MTHEFDRDYWEQHWRQRPIGTRGSMATNPPNPYLARETENLAIGTALDAGCGAGAEAIWLAFAGWRVTAVDISPEALGIAAERAATSGVADRIRWVEADLSVWQPDRQFDLVTSHYAHPAIPQLDFYTRLATWVKPGGTLLIVGHLHTSGDANHAHHPAEEVAVTVAAITERLDPTDWRVETADECHRTLSGSGGREVSLHDVVVRATRLD